MSATCRIVVIGATATGKSYLVHRFVSNEIPTSYDPTIEDFYETEYFLGNKMLKVHLTDTAGKELFFGMRRRYVTGSHGFIVAYSVKNRQSLLEAVKICYALGPVPKILVGCKADADWHYREVSPSEGRLFAARLNCSFAESSSISGANVREIFHELLVQIQDYKQWKKNQKRTSLCCFM